MPFLVLLTTCASLPAKSPTLSVLEVSRQRDALDGKVIRVGGLVRNCQRLSCALVSPTNERHYISIGRSESFDRDIQHALNREVVVEGRLNQSCVNDFDHDSLALCSDRPNSLANPALVWPKIR